MTQEERRNLDRLLEIADEEDTPLRVKDIEFLRSLSERRSIDLSTRQTYWFDDLVREHLGEHND